MPDLVEEFDGISGIARELRERVTVPDRMSADLDPKTQKSILKQAGLA